MLRRRAVVARARALRGRAARHRGGVRGARRRRRRRGANHAHGVTLKPCARNKTKYQLKLNTHTSCFGHIVYV